MSSVIVCLAILQLANGARPFYIIGHMTNTVDEAKDFLGRGANSLEIDVSFNVKNVSDISAFHDIPCDCFRICRRTRPLQDLLEFSREHSSRLALLFLDIKLGNFPMGLKKNAGRALANHLQRYLWKNANAKTKVLISIERPSDQEFILGVMSGIDQNVKKNVGWDVSMNFPIEEIRALWGSIEVEPKQFWQGDGITNCLSPFRGFERLRESLRERNKNKGYISKVYHWTIDFRFHMRYSMQHNIDGFITNHPERAVEILREFGPRRFRLATPQDDPWLKVPDPPEITQTYPDESNIQRLLQGFSLLQVGRDLRDSARNLFGELLNSAGSNLIGRQLGEESDFREVFNFLEAVDQINQSAPADSGTPPLFEGPERGMNNEARSLGGNNRRVDSNDRRVDSNDRRVDSNNRRVDINDRRVDSNNRRVDSNNRHVDSNNRREDSNDRPLDSNGWRVDSNSRRVDSNGWRVDNNNRRINSNDRGVDSNNLRVDSNDRPVDSNGWRVDSNHRSVDSNGWRVNSDGGRAGSNDRRVKYNDHREDNGYPRPANNGHSGNVGDRPVVYPEP